MEAEETAHEETTSTILDTYEIYQRLIYHKSVN